jgi:hypothetical protein
LTERIASPRTIPHRTRKVETNADLAKRRMQRWQAQAPFTTGSYGAQAAVQLERLPAIDRLAAHMPDPLR